METGETNPRTGDELILGWDGDTLRWILLAHQEIVAHGSAPRTDDWSTLTRELPEAEHTRIALVHPVISLMPSAVAKGIEDRISLLHHGASQSGHRSFQSDRLGEGMSLIESGHGEQSSFMAEHWPTARWSSWALGWLEVQSQLAAQSEHDAFLGIEVGMHRAMMCRFDSGRLMWSTVTEDLEGAGILYHCVNAMVRDGMALDGVSLEVQIQGAAARKDHLIEQFSRFFRVVNEASPRVTWGDAAPEDPACWTTLAFAKR